MAVVEPLLEKTVDAHPSGLCLSVKGELSPSTVPALRSLVEAFHDTRERVVELDLREAKVGPAVDRVLDRWGLTAADIAGVYRVPQH